MFCSSILYIMVFFFNFTFFFFFFIKLSYIFLEFQDVSSEKSKVPTILTVLLITVNVWKGSMIKSLSVFKYEKWYILASDIWYTIHVRTCISKRWYSYLAVLFDKE
jgi:hypothetical protein